MQKKSAFLAILGFAIILTAILLFIEGIDWIQKSDTMDRFYKASEAWVLKRPTSTLSIYWGIPLMAIIWYLIVALIRRGNPILKNAAIIPAIIAGLITIGLIINIISGKHDLVFILSAVLRPCAYLIGRVLGFFLLLFFCLVLPLMGGFLLIKKNT